jgi:hypothetical protein
LGFAFAGPGPLKVEKGTYNSPIAGQRETIVYSFTDDNIEYRVHVIDMRDRANEAANLLGEAQFLFQDKKRVLMDAFGRVDRQYGRKLTVDLPNNAGRSFRFRRRSCRPMATTKRPRPDGSSIRSRSSRFARPTMRSSCRRPDNLRVAIHSIRGEHECADGCWQQSSVRPS